MTVTGPSQAAHGPSTHSMQAVGHHRQGGHRSASMSDIDAQGSSVTSVPSATGKIGSKLDVSA